MFKVFGFNNETIFRGGENAAEAFFIRLGKGDYGAHNLCSAMIMQTDSLEKAIRDAESHRKTDFFDGCIFIWDDEKQKWYDPEYKEYMDED